MRHRINALDMPEAIAEGKALDAWQGNRSQIRARRLARETGPIEYARWRFWVLSALSGYRPQLAKVGLAKSNPGALLTSL
jgi:hypothetical protein